MKNLQRHIEYAKAMGVLNRHAAAVELGRLGGLSKSKRKAEAARENGKLGGRPKKLGADRNSPKI